MGKKKKITKPKSASKSDSAKDLENMEEELHQTREASSKTPAKQKKSKKTKKSKTQTTTSKKVSKKENITKKKKTSKKTSKKSNVSKKTSKKTNKKTGKKTSKKTKITKKTTLNKKKKQSHKVSKSKSSQKKKTSTSSAIFHLEPIPESNEKYNFNGDELLQSEVLVLVQLEKALKSPLKKKYISNGKTTGYILKDGFVDAIDIVQNENFAGLPDNLHFLTHLKSLVIKFTNLHTLTPALGYLSSLESLNLENNHISFLPDTFGHLRSLKTLLLSTNQLEILPEPLLELDGLQKIDLSNNKLSDLPTTWKKSSNLVFLDLAFNQLQSIPSECGNLQKLRILNLSNNQINLLSHQFGELQLDTLYLNNNLLNGLPDSFSKLPLIYLNLEHNRFLSIPAEIGSLKHLKTLLLKNNPYQGKSIQYQHRDLKSILKWCQKRAKIHVFLSHAVIDYEMFRVAEIDQYLEQQEEINEAFHCEEDLVGNIDNFMNEYVPRSQMILFFATKKSVYHSPDCKKEINLARQNSIEIIPIKGPDLGWNELEALDLHRDFGLEFSADNFDEFLPQLYELIIKIKHNINLFEKNQATLDKKRYKIQNFLLNFLESDDFRKIFEQNLDKFSDLIERMDALAISQNDFAYEFSSLLFTLFKM